MSVATNSIRVLCLGDVVGRSGRRAVSMRLPALRKELGAHFVVVNGENASGGVGIDPKSARELWEAGADVITLGDHTWQRSEAAPFLAQRPERCIRPANYPDSAPGLGATRLTTREGVEVGVMNLMGRVFLEIPLGCPFDRAEQILAEELAGCRIVIVDMHAEACSEKGVMGRVLDGRVSCVFGTHTHVQTADECILPGGTAFISDLGMCGPEISVTGMRIETAVKRLRTGMKHPYELGEGDVLLQGVLLTIDAASGRAQSIVRVRERVAVG